MAFVNEVDLICKCWWNMLVNFSNNFRKYKLSCCVMHYEITSEVCITGGQSSEQQRGIGNPIKCLHCPVTSHPLLPTSPVVQLLWEFCQFALIHTLKCIV